MYCSVEQKMHGSRPRTPKLKYPTPRALDDNRRSDVEVVLAAETEGIHNTRTRYPF